MNFKQMLQVRLEEMGVVEWHARAIVEVAINDPEWLPSMWPRWNHEVESYTPGFSNVIFASLRPIAYQWLTANAPKAWYRPVFAEGIEDLNEEELKAFLDKWQKENFPEA